MIANDRHAQNPVLARDVKADFPEAEYRLIDRRSFDQCMENEESITGTESEQA